MKSALRRNAAYKKSMVSRNFSALRSDKGFVLIDALMGIALGVLILAGVVGAVSGAFSRAHDATVQDSTNTSLTQALERTSQQVQVSAPILYAGANDMAVEFIDPGSKARTAVRWVLSGSTYYEQVWSGSSNAFPESPIDWIPVSKATAAAPNGDGAQTTIAMVKNVNMNGSSVLTYKDSSGTAVVPPAGGLITAVDADTTHKTTSVIRSVTIHLRANTVRAGFLENQVTAMPRNYAGGSGAGVSPSGDLACPATNLVASGSNARIVFSTVPGAASYVIKRNGAIVTTLTLAPDATSGSWTDTNPASDPSAAVTYLVVARTSAGVESTLTCRPNVWRGVVAQPILKNAAVTPVGAGPDAWGSPNVLKTPRITLNWDAVAGATGYQIFYRQVDPASGSPLAGADTFAQLVAPGASTTTYVWDGGGWGTRYEWYIVANSLSARSIESPHIQTLTHPHAPTNVTVSAAYGGTTASPDQINGLNNISWNAVTSATSYQVWVYKEGSASGNATLKATVSSPNTKYQDTEPYGSTYTYFVSAVNSGPRGSDSSGATLADEKRASPGPVDLSSGQVTGLASNIIPLASNITPLGATGDNTTAQKVTQLQYPPVPGIIPIGTAADGSVTRDFNGYNNIVWSPVRTATGYFVERIQKGMDPSHPDTVACVQGTGTNCTEGHPTTSTSVTNSVAKGTQYSYLVRATNQTGLSVGYSSATIVTQRPAAPVLTISRKPTPSNNDTDFTMKQDGDGGNPAGYKFCSSTTCRYEVVSGATVKDYNHAQSGALVTASNVPSPAGSTTTVNGRMKNAAITNSGWSDYSSAITNTYPGDFAVNAVIGDGAGGHRQRTRLTEQSIDVVNGQPESSGQTTVAWGASAGATNTRVVRNSFAGDSVSTDPSLGLSTSSQPSTSGASGQWSVVASPGAGFQYAVTATAANGLSRVVYSPILVTPADIPATGVLSVVCSGTDTVYNNPSNDFPYQKIAARLSSFIPAVRYGGMGATTVVGVYTVKGSGTLYATGVKWTIPAGQAAPSYITSGTGYGYYYGLENGFQLTVAGPTFAGYTGGYSLTLEGLFQAGATFQDGCAPAGQTGDSLVEPGDACYYFDGTSCATVNPGNRPKWTSR